MGTEAAHPPWSELAAGWSLDHTVVFLNHGSFGACPRAVLDAQSAIRERIEAEPVRFFLRELPDLLDASRSTLADFVGADADGLAFVSNATAGVNTALAAVELEAGDEILVTDHGYAACRNAAEVRARRARARVVEASVPFPGATPDRVIEAVLAAVTARTRVALIDHVTSPTGLVFPIVDLLRLFEERGIVTIVDGAHAPGMVDLDIDGIAAPFYTGNCHKWLCAPKGAAFLWVREDWRRRIRPLMISHGASAPLDGGDRFRREFDWTGTYDPTPWLTVPSAIDGVAAMVPGGWPEVRRRNRDLVLRARRELCAVLDITSPPCPEVMIGSMAALPVSGDRSEAAATTTGIDPLQDRLFERFGIEVPITGWGTPPRRAVRLSAHLYNSIDQFRFLAGAMRMLSAAAG